MGKAHYIINEGRHQVILHFNRKPEKEIIDLMKMSGFVYTPRYASWNAELTDGTLALCKLICQKDEDRRSVDHHPASFEFLEKIDDVISDEEPKKAFVKLIPVIKEDLDDVLGSYLDNQRDIVDAEKEFQDILEQHKEVIDPVKLKKTVAGMSNDAICLALGAYMRENGKSLVEGKRLSALMHSEKLYALSERTETRFRSVLKKAGLPDWVGVEFNVDNKVLEAMETIPEGVTLESVNSELTVFDNDGFNALDATREAAVKMFVDDSSVPNIARRLRIEETLVYELLSRALKAGNNELYAYLTPGAVEAVRGEYEGGNENVEAIANETDLPEDFVKIIKMFLDKE